MSYPQVVALDTDGTIWKDFLDNTWGKGANAATPVEDNIERPPSQNKLLQDKTNHAKSITVFDDISKIVNDVLKNGAKLAIVSRNPSKAMCDRALYYFSTINPQNNNEWSIIHLVNYDEVVDESKANHFKRIQGWSGSDYSDMVMFDDEAFNNVVRIELGVTFEFLRNSEGLTWDAYRRGVEAWQRVKNMMFTSPASSPTRARIGYTGLNAFWIDLVRRGEGIVDTSTSYRWGYALYVTDTFGIAKAYRTWEKQAFNRVSYVCEVWVKDYDAWMRLNKIWVPEHSGSLPTMDSSGWTPEASGRNQEDRDRFIASQWNVRTPYVLFSRHFWFQSLPPPSDQRWSEMVLSTQIVRSMIELVQLTDAQVDQVPEPAPSPFYEHIREWNITVPAETKAEFQLLNETALVQASQ